MSIAKPFILIMHTIVSGAKYSQMSNHQSKEQREREREKGKKERAGNSKWDEI